MTVLSYMEKDYKAKGKQVYGELSDYVVLDTETTGLNAINGSIIEFGIVKVENYKLVDTFQSFVNPHESVTGFITSLTGITNDMLENAPDIQQVLPQVLDFIGDKTVIAHNASFDIGFLTATCVKTIGTPFLNDYLDTVRMSRKLFPEHSHHRLSDLVNRFGINTEVYHRALSDAADTQKCYEYMCDYMDRCDIPVEALMPKTKKSSKRKALPIDESSFAFGKNFVISASISVIPQKQAQRAIIALGGLCNEEATADFIVMGNIEYEMMNAFKTGKELKISQNGPTIISETSFIKMLNEVKK